MNCSPESILDYLNRARVRCTYGAFGDILGLPAIAVGRQLSPRRPYASWVVNAGTGKPTGYAPADEHPDLYRTNDIIKTGGELRRRMQRNEDL